MTKILAENKEEALRQLIEITNAAANSVQVESNAVATNDAVGYILNEGTKDDAYAKYEVAAAEFHAELERFRGCDPALLDELDQALKRLGSSAKASNELMDKIR